MLAAYLDKPASSVMRPELGDWASDPRDASLMLPRRPELSTRRTLEHALRKIDAYCSDINGGRSFPSEWSVHFHSGTSMPLEGGGVHPIVRLANWHLS